MFGSTDAASKYSLTEQLMEGSALCHLDLGSGYPVFPLSEALVNLVIEGSRIALQASERFSKTERLLQLQESVGNLLHIPVSLRGKIRPTFSGAVALERVFVAIEEIARSSGNQGLTAIVTEPSIDLSRLLLSERSDIKIVAVPRIESFEETLVDRLITTLEFEARLSPHRKLLVLLDSPSNPLGLVLDKNSLDGLSTACGCVGATLIVDHCFLLAGVQSPKMLPNLFRIDGSVCDWIGVWDTGKTIDMGGDKLGFVIPGNLRMSSAVDKSLSVIQSGPSKRAIEIFSRLLRAPALIDYLNEAGRICRVNLNQLQAGIPSTMYVPSPRAGTFGCVHVPNFTEGSDALRSAWMNAGVSVISGRTFFDSFQEGTPFLRVSLLRDPVFFKSAIDLSRRWSDRPPCL